MADKSAVQKLPHQETPERFLPAIVRPYLLCVDVACYRDAHGRRYLDPSWHKDLVEHVRYLKDLTVACPFRNTTDSTHLASLDDPDSPLSHVKFVELPRTSTLVDAVCKIPRLVWILWRAVGEADICHFGVYSWPIGSVWFALPIARLRGRFTIIVVENSAWRLDGLALPTVRRRIRASVVERLNRWCINAAQLAILTHEGYFRELVSHDRRHGYVIPASWIDEDDILSDSDALSVWSDKPPLPDQELRLLFVGRLVEEKGIRNLLEAMRHIAQRNLPVRLDVVGGGPLEAECRAAARSIDRPAHVELLGPVRHGSDLFRLIRRYHAVVVPSLSGEQPRIVFDAFSQAVPLLVTPTDALRACVEPGVTGFVAESNEPCGLADLLMHALQNRSQLERMGIASVNVARRWTHRSMHRARWELLVDALADWRG